MRLSSPRLQRQFLERPAVDCSPGAATILPNSASVREVVASMHASRPTGAVLIAGSDGTPQHIITERDLLKLNLWETTVLSRTAREVCSPKLTCLPPRASLARALHLMATERHRHIPLVAKDPKETKILSALSILHEIGTQLTNQLSSGQEAPQLGSGPLATFLEDSLGSAPLSPPLSATLTTNIAQAVQSMRNAGKGAIVIVDERKHPIGIFTEYDFVKAASQGQATFQNLPISTVMSKPVRSLLRSASIALAIKLFAEHRFRHLPIVDHDETLYRMLSIRHVVAALASAILEELTPATPPSKA